LRHNTATYLLAAGVPVRAAMEFLGHSQVTTTMRYQHVLPTMLDDAAARLEKVFPIQAGRD
jgi:site-specific recombinase XerD